MCLEDAAKREGTSYLGVTVCVSEYVCVHLFEASLQNQATKVLRKVSPRQCF